MPYLRHDPIALFEEDDLWDRFTDNPLVEERTRIVLEMLPDEARTALDVGCGNGVLVRSLSERLWTIGLDPSRKGLSSFAGLRICGVGERLPVRIRSVDIVFCLEVLEHLDNERVMACAREVAQATRRWLLIATPDREELMRNALRCPPCGCVFNRSHHLQQFDLDRLSRLFPDFLIREVRRGGQAVRPYPSSLLRLRHRLARRYFNGPGETRGLCPRCGNREFPPFRWNLLSLLLDGVNRLISRRRPYWVLLLFERRQAGG